MNSKMLDFKRKLRNKRKRVVVCNTKTKFIRQISHVTRVITRVEESEEENATPLSLMGTFNFPTMYAKSSSKKFNVSNMLPSPSPPPSLRNMKRVADNTSPSTKILASPRFDYVNTFSCSPSPPNPPINPVVPNISNISFCKDIPRQPTGRGPKITPNEAKSRQKRCEWGEYEIYELIMWSCR